MSHAPRIPSPSAQTSRTSRVNRAAALGLVFALWLALGAFSAWNLNAERHNERLQTEALASALASHTTRVLREANQVADVVTWLVKRDGPELALEDYVHSGLVDLDVFTQVAVIDKHGILRASTFHGFVPMDHTDRDYYRVHMDDPSARLFISKPVIDRVSGERSVQLSRRINDPQGRFVGVVVVSVPPSVFTELLESARIGRDGLFAVIGTNDYVLRARRTGTHYNFDTSWPIPPRSPLRIALARALRGTFEAASFYDGVQRTISYERLADYPVVAMVGYVMATAPSGA